MSRFKDMAITFIYTTTNTAEEQIQILMQAWSGVEKTKRDEVNEAY